MGSSESKMNVAAPIKPEPAVKNCPVAPVVDPRSPSTGIDRTPIQVNGLVTKPSVKGKIEFPLAFTDPRSPTIGINRTPARDVMRATVGSFARRLGMLFHNESEGKVAEGPRESFGANLEEEAEERGSTAPLLTPRPPVTYSSMAQHADLLVTPVEVPPNGLADSSPFVILQEPQEQVEVVTEADFSLEEAEEARESPLHKRLSMSLITYHDGATSSQIFAEVHREGAFSPVPSVEVGPSGDGVEHSYALPTITVEPESPVEPAPTSEEAECPVETPSAAQPEEAQTPSEETQEDVEGPSLPPAAVPAKAPAVPDPAKPQLCEGIRCPTFDPKSPSQVVFKPQWLGKGFGATRGRGGKGGSSPLAVRVTVRNANNENKGQSAKLKQKGTRGRSPLQILKEANSPRDQRSQMKVKVATPDRQRQGQMERRVLSVAQDKENR